VAPVKEDRAVPRGTMTPNLPRANPGIRVHPFRNLEEQLFRWCIPYGLVDNSIGGEQADLNRSGLFFDVGNIAEPRLPGGHPNADRCGAKALSLDFVRPAPATAASRLQIRDRATAACETPGDCRAYGIARSDK